MYAHTHTNVYLLCFSARMIKYDLYYSVIRIMATQLVCGGSHDLGSRQSPVGSQLALKRRLIVAPLKLLTGRLAQVFATGFALGDGGRLNGRFVPRSRADCRSVERSAQDRRLES